MKKHYQLKWNILRAVKVVEAFEKVHGKKPLTYTCLRKIYTGNLLEASYFGKIPKRNLYGVTFETKIKLTDGREVIDTTGF